VDLAKHCQLNAKIGDLNAQRAELAAQLKKLDPKAGAQEAASLKQQMDAAAAQIDQLRKSLPECQLWKTECPPCQALRRRERTSDITHASQIRNPKHEIRNKSKIRNNKSETRTGCRCC
jgi:hypothetical protein